MKTMLFKTLDDLRHTPEPVVIQFFRTSVFRGRFSTSDIYDNNKFYCGKLTDLSYYGKLVTFMPSSFNVLKVYNLTQDSFYDVKFGVDTEKLKNGSMHFLRLKSINLVGKDEIVQEHKDTCRVLTPMDSKVLVEVLNIVYRDDTYFYKVRFNDKFNFIPLRPEEVCMMDSVKNIKFFRCEFHGYGDDGSPILEPGKPVLIDDLYEADTVRQFTVLDTCFDYHNEKYYRVIDSFGLRHRFYGDKEAVKYRKGDQLNLYIKDIDKNNNTLTLALVKGDAESLVLAKNYSKEELEFIRNMADSEENNGEKGKCASLILAYQYALKAGASITTLKSLRSDIKEFTDQRITMSSEHNDPTINNSEEANTGFDDDTKELTDNSLEKGVQDESKLSEDKFKDENKSLAVIVRSDGTYTVTDGSVTEHSDSRIENFEIPPISFNGILLLFNYDGSFAKVELQNLCKSERDKENTSNINPHNVCNLFVVPTECIVGMMIVSESGRFIEMHRTKDLASSNFDNVDYIRCSDPGVTRFLPFILPETYSNEFSSFLKSRSIRIKDLSVKCRKTLRSFGVNFNL